jgi:hypothetical protein
MLLTVICGMWKAAYQSEDFTKKKTDVANFTATTPLKLLS